MTFVMTLKRYSIAILCAITLIAVAQNSSALTADIGFVSAPPHLGLNVGPVNGIRYEALRQAATSIGARSGLAWQARNIDFSLRAEEVFLDQIFDFNQLMLNHNVMPPVLVESDNNLALDDDETLRINTKTYRIIRPARFVTAPLNWRDYLWMRFDPPALSDRSLLPTTRTETKLWNHFVRVGWHDGEVQADMIFTQNLNRLKRDMLGMILYRKLLALHMVSPPFVAKAQMGVTGDATQLRIDDELLRITAQSELQPNPKGWRPVMTK